MQNDGYQNDDGINGDRILLLEQQITQLNRMVDMLKAQVQIYLLLKLELYIALNKSGIQTRARENRKNNRSGPKLRILDRFQTPQNANKSVQHFPNQPIFTNQ